VDVPYSQTVTAIGGTAPYSYALTSGALPTGLSLDSNGLVSGTVTEVGSFNITITATDSSTGNGPFTGSKSYILATNLVFTPATLPNAQVGTPYSQTITASGGGATFSYALTSGAFPAGLSLGSDGLISGTPTAGGTFIIEITATDTAGIYSGTQAYTLIVASVTTTTASDASAPLSASNQNVTLAAAVTSPGGIVHAGTLMFQVKNGGTAIGKAVTSAPLSNGTASVTYVLPAGTPRGVYTILASYSGTATISASSDNTHSLTVHAPDLSSGPTASPSTVGVGQTVTFNVAATDEFGDALRYTWQFGDSLVGSGDSITHAYAAAGTYTATVTVSDGRGGTVAGSVSVLVKAPLYGTGLDGDGDGFSDGFEIGSGSDPANAANTPLGSEAAPAPATLIVKALSVKINFVKHNDSVSLSGSLPAAAASSFAGKPLTVQVSGYVKGFTLDVKGHSSPKENSFFVIAKPRNAISKFTLKVAKTNVSAFFVDAGLTPIASPNTPVHIQMTVLFNAVAYQSTVTLLFTQKKGIAGSTKPVR
jgi:plastocyanin